VDIWENYLTILTAWLYCKVGLSMMDPNSYYDKQGFGSVFTGLNKGFGAAQDSFQGEWESLQPKGGGWSVREVK
jgi:hypothetical protein